MRSKLAEEAHQEVLAYNEYVAALVVNRRTNVEAWYRRWERAYLVAKFKKLSFVEGLLAKYTFLNAIKNFAPRTAFLLRYDIELRMFMNDPPETLEKIGRLFFHVWQTTNESFHKAKIPLGSPAMRRGKSNSASPVPLCLCGRTHAWKPEKCYNVVYALCNIKLKGARYKPSKAAIKRICEKAEDEEYADVVARIRAAN